jgi:predicted ATP-grasp superfamily ATP-dependent carboligase
MSTIWAIGASVRALAQSLKAAGHTVVAADLFNDLDLQRIARQTRRIVDYPHDLLQLVGDVEADAFIYTGGLENYPDLIDALARKLPLIGNPGHVLRRVRDVTTLQTVLKSGGFAVPPMAQVKSADAQHRWLRKSQDSSGGLRVAWAGSQLSGGEYFQQFIDGAVLGASFLVSSSGVQLRGVARQLVDSPWTGAPRFHYAGSLGPIPLSEPRRRDLQRLGELLAAEFELQGWFGVDFIADDQERLWILEVNPRYTASMELLEHSAPVSGKAILYTNRRIDVTAAFVERLLERGDVADIPCAGFEIPAASPVLSCFARGDSEAAVLPELQGKSFALQTEIAKLANSVVRAP